MNNKQLFREWKFDRFTVESPDRNYSLWIASGRSCFRDYASSGFLQGSTFFERNRLWKMIKKEQRRRFLQRINYSN